MLVPIGQAALEDDKPIHVGGISLEWLPGVFTEGDDRIVWLLLLLGALIVIKVLAGFGKEILAARASRDLWMMFVTDLTSGYLARSFAAQSAESSGVVINLAAREANRAANVITIFVSWLSGLVTSLMLVAAMAVVDWRVVAGGAIVGLLAYSAVLRPMMRRSKQVGQESIAVNRDLTTLVSQTIQGVKDIVLLNLQTERAQAVERQAKEAAALDLRNAVLQATPPYGMEMVFALVLLLLASALVVTDPGDPASWLPGLLFFIASTARLAAQGSALTSSLIKMNNRYPSFEHLVARVRETPELPSEGPDTRRIEQLDGPISVRGLRFDHKEGHPVLRDVNVDIPSDRLTFLIGASGSGKSTFIDILARLHLPQAGTIVAAGHDYRDYALTDWRRRVAYVSQTPVLFSGSVRENVTAADERIDDAAVTRALALAGAESFVAALPAGLDTMLGERGHGVSGGQRCRLAVARALVREPSLLMLDESTSGVEPALERLILSDLKQIPGLGLLVVTHRRDNIDLADLVVELVDGRVVVAPPALAAVQRNV